MHSKPHLATHLVSTRADLVAKHHKHHTLQHWGHGMRYVVHGMFDVMTILLAATEKCPPSADHRKVDNFDTYCAVNGSKTHTRKPCKNS